MKRALPFYAVDDDFRVIVDWLNQDEEIAFIVSEGPTRWKAVRQINFHHVPKDCSLWHVPAGQLPLVGSGEEGRVVEDPFSGWEDPRFQQRSQYADFVPSPSPYFGPGCPVVIDLSFRPKGRLVDSVGLSNFGWIGGHYSSIGSPAPEEPRKWWDKLRRWMDKTSAKRIGRSGPMSGDDKEIYCFRGAYELFLIGTPRDENPS